ncbi:MAG TPA: Ig-like domain-containing protein [Spirochaetia bacterium]|nr:Ig-like domain-containing protein [Spirochaetales bacterium]HRW24057.1 Ig-like domain-containing protein [Spirochaetia bacterium]
MARIKRLSAVTAAAFLASCVPEPSPEWFSADDLRPPAVASWGPTGPSELVIGFDEEIASAEPGFASYPGPAVASAVPGDDGRSVRVTLDGVLAPGAAYSVSGVVADAAGNLSGFALPYWGYNPDPPVMLINELITEGSATHPDAVEFYVAEAGDCAGLAFFVGSPSDYACRYVFPPLAADAGDYVTLHLKPQGDDGEVDESAAKDESAGLDASAGAWDLWYRGGDGALPGKNGAVALCSSPRGAILDAVAYSERYADSDTAYGGFGTAALRDRVAEIAAAGAWAASDPPRPEDCARSTGTTSTRSLCRSSASDDTDSGADWHVVPTRGSTIGAANSDEAYVP